MAGTASRYGSRNAPKIAPCSRKSRTCNRKTSTCASRSKRLQSDPEEIEREAREKLHYAKPGEVIYTLPTPTQGQQPAGK